MKEGCEQDGPLHRPSNEPDDRSERLSPRHSQRDLDEETSVDAMTVVIKYNKLSTYQKKA